MSAAPSRRRPKRRQGGALQGGPPSQPHSVPALVIRTRFRTQLFYSSSSRLFFQCANFGGLRRTGRHSFRWSIIELRNLLSQFLQTDSFVSILASFFLRSNCDAGREVPQPNSTLRLIDVLTSWPTRAERFDFAFPQQIFVRLRKFDHVF
jgi:hypothetical protein